MALLLGSEKTYTSISSASVPLSHRNVTSLYGGPSSLNPDHHQKKPSVPNEDYRFKNTGIIPLIFELVVEGSHSDAELHGRILREFLFLLVHSTHNRTQFLEASFIGAPSSQTRIGTWQWKAWLFGLLGKNNALFTQILSFFVILLDHIISGKCLLSSSASPEAAAKLAKDQLREMQSLCKYFGEKGGFFDWTNFCGHLHRRLFSLILHTIRNFDPTWITVSSDEDFAVISAAEVPPLPPRPSGRSRSASGVGVPPTRATHQKQGTTTERDKLYSGM